MSKQLRVNPIACSGHGLCAELLPELITLDEWGYPVLDGQPVPPGLDRVARRAAAKIRWARTDAPEPSDTRSEGVGLRALAAALAWV